MRLKTADLNLILEANGKPTGDQLIAEVAKAEREAKELRRKPTKLTKKQWQALKRMYRKQGISNPPIPTQPDSAAT